MFWGEVEYLNGGVFCLGGGGGGVHGVFHGRKG